MVTINKIVICICFGFLFCSCQHLLYKDKLDQILGINQINIEASKQIDEIGGFGEGKTIEIYTLSEATINNFINQSDKILPNKNNWFKYDWTQGNINSFCKPIIDLSLNYKGETEIEDQLAEIKKSIPNANMYISFYYNEKDIELSTQAQLMILDLETKNLYIIDTIM